MKFFLVIILLLSVPALYSQQFHFGPKIDVSISQFDGKGLNNGSPGLQAGVFMQWEISKKWSIQPELFYSLRNVTKAADFMTYYVNTGRSDGIRNMQLNYVCVPVLARFDINEKFALLAGPQFNYLFFANEDLLLSNKKAFKKTEVGMSMGAQFNLSRLGVSLRYNPRLYNINNIDDRYQWKSSQVQIGIAVRVK
jgi:hypothetical protein